MSRGVVVAAVVALVWAGVVAAMAAPWFACHYPCWRLIVPGETTVETARDLLRSDLEITTFGDYSEYHDADESRFAWTARPWLTRSLVQRQSVVVRTDQTRVLAIRLRTPYALTLGEILARYGQPEAWQFSYERGIELVEPTTVMRLFYPPQGMIVRFRINRFAAAAGTFTLSAGLPLDEIELLPRSESTEALMQLAPVDDGLRPLSADLLMRENFPPFESFIVLPADVGDGPFQPMILEPG